MRGQDCKGSKKNALKIQALGLHEKAKSLMGRYQTEKGSHGKINKKKDAEEDEIYRPDQDSDIDEHEHDSSFEGTRIKETLSNQGSNSNRKKIFKMKRARKAIAMAMAYKKRQQNLEPISSAIKTNDAAAQQPTETTLGLSNGIEKSRRGPTMCYKVHGRTEDERLEITLNKHGQPVGPDDDTCNEFISFLGTRKENKHYIVPVKAKRWVLQAIGAAWRRYKCYLKRVHFHKYDNDKMRLMDPPKRVPKTMFKELLKIWNDEKYEEQCMQNKANRLVGKEKNIMHTSGPKSFASVRYKWKKDRKTTQNPTLAQMFIETRKEKLTKRKPGDLRDKLINELQDSEKDVDSVISTIIGSNNKKKSHINLYGRSVSSTQLKKKALMKEVEEKHAREVEALQKNYEDKRQQDRREMANGLSFFFSQLQQQNPQMSFDLSMFGSLFLESQTEKDGNTAGMLRLQPSASTSKGVNSMENEQDEEDDSEVEGGGDVVNYSANFVTDTVFRTFEDAVKWEDAVAINL
ncbi:uncharacterized protein LOC110728763 [Chenopodium quinoa]|uniref:uncharacterized protein LOC110728763 n=1 Tax=Chenopodium quinoa TaxID=63459 RepID=UPI000B778E12|nr:uncharacterized protein LOC110728763 [Chenopodium quinoa]